MLWEPMLLSPTLRRYEGMQELPSSSTIESPPHIALDVSAKLMEDTAFFHDVISDWIEDPNTTIACGRWSDGAVSEIIPSGRARLLIARYHGCFAGTRDPAGRRATPSPR